VCAFLLFVAPRHFFTGTAIITLLTLAVAPILGTSGNGFFFDGLWLSFAEGVGVYYILNYAKSRLSGIVFFVLVLVGIPALRWALPGVWANGLPTSTVFALILIIMHPYDHRIAGAPVLRPIAFCGTMCYSLYLVHWPITCVMTDAFYRAGVRGTWQTLLIVTPLTILVSIAASALFHVKIERHFLNSPIVSKEPERAHSLCRSTLHLLTRRLRLSVQSSPPDPIGANSAGI
jgi:peptidoglycan/LPS O-acetylase OafA/YrhL